MRKTCQIAEQKRNINRPKMDRGVNPNTESINAVKQVNHSKNKDDDDDENIHSAF